MDDVLTEQIAYYRARAPEYDEWCDRTGPFDHGPAAAELWRSEVDVVRSALERFSPRGDVLELACGTGWWTQELARFASSLTCVDASPEVIERARARAPAARFVNADIFSWEIEATYDVVFFSFWVSHVPADRFDWFWSVVRRALRPNGRVFFIDNLRRPVATGGMAQFLQSDVSPDGIVTRRLNDGTEFRAVKIYYEPEQLVDRLGALGWRAEVYGTDTFFYYGWCSGG